LDFIAKDQNQTRREKERTKSDRRKKKETWSIEKKEMIVPLKIGKI
jgi:hypothetical protein